jgi:hypothetical protein
MNLLAKLFSAVIAVSAVSLPTWKAESQQIQSLLANHQVGVPYDWTHRHVFFSAASRETTESTENFAAIRLELRYWIQHIRRRQEIAAPTEPGTKSPSPPHDFRKFKKGSSEIGLKLSKQEE